MANRRGWVWPALAVLVAAFTMRDTLDLGLMLHAGHDSLTSHGLHVYADTRGLQTGPLSLPVFGVLDLAGPAADSLIRLLTAAIAVAVLIAASRAADAAHSDPVPAATAPAADVQPPWWLVPVIAVLPALSYHMPPVDAQMVLVWAALAGALAAYALTRRLAGRPAPVVRLTRLQWMGVLVAGPWASLAIGSAHLEDGLAIGGLILAVLAQRRGRVGWAGLLVGIAVAFKPWAVVGVAIPLCGGTARRRDRVRATALALGVPALAFVPFVLADHGTLHAFAASFTVRGSAPVRLLGLSAGQPSPAWLRSFQLGAALLVAVVTTRRRGAADGVAAGLLARLLLDPSTFAYYASGAALATAAADLLAGRKGGRSAAVLGLWLMYRMLTGDWGLAVLQAVWLLALIASFVVRPGTRSRLRRSAETGPVAAQGVAGCFAGQPASMSLQLRTRPVAGSVSRYSE